GNNIHAAANRIRSYVFDRGLPAAQQWTNTSGPTGALVDTTQIAYWNSDPTKTDESLNGAKWAVQFKINLPAQITAENALFFAAAHLTYGTDTDGVAIAANNATGN